MLLGLKCVPSINGNEADFQKWSLTTRYSSVSCTDITLRGVYTFLHGMKEFWESLTGITCVVLYKHLYSNKENQQKTLFFPIN